MEQRYPYRVDSNRFYSEILEWLQTNVGNILWSQPIIAWHGDGWNMKLSKKVGKTYFIVEFEDKEKALMFGLWA